MSVYVGPYGPPDQDPDAILADALDWVAREQRHMRDALGVLAGDLDACRRVVSRRQSYANFDAGKAYYREGQAR